MSKAALCIGVVAVAASGSGRYGLGDAVDRGGRDALRIAGEACVAESVCLRGVAAAVAVAGAGLAVPMRPAADTLTAADRMTAWHGPATRPRAGAAARS